jgi:type II secretory pathway component PulM
MNDEGKAMQWLVRTLGRQANGEATFAALHGAGSGLTGDELMRLVRRSAAMGLVAYRGADGDDETQVWLTAQGDQALGSLDALDEAQG